MFPVHVLVACKIIGHKAKVWIIVAGSGSRVKVIGNRARAIWGKKTGGRWRWSAGKEQAGILTRSPRGGEA